MGKAPKVALGICVRLQKNFHLISKQTKFRNFDPCCFEAIRRRRVKLLPRFRRIWPERSGRPVDPVETGQVGIDQ